MRLLHGCHAWLCKGTHRWFGQTKEGKECLRDAVASQRGVDNGDAPINPREDEVFGVPHPSGGPGRAPWRLNGREENKQARDRNAHVDISSPRGRLCDWVSGGWGGVGGGGG